MLISDWSSDVCSSDLCASAHQQPLGARKIGGAIVEAVEAAVDAPGDLAQVVLVGEIVQLAAVPEPAGDIDGKVGIGRHQAGIGAVLEILAAGPAVVAVVDAAGQLDQAAPLDARPVARLGDRKSGRVGKSG